MEGTNNGLPKYDPGMVQRRGRLHSLARLIRVEHTIFSLPYAYLGGLLASNMTLKEFLLITLAVLGLRTAAMSYNNIADLDIDKLNPRSKMRPLVIGSVSIRDAWLLVLAGSIIYYFSAALLNYVALLLSPILWIVALTYPYAKRLHNYPHFHLGLTLGLVVFGGAVATYGDQAVSVYDTIVRVPWDIVVGVTCWVAGFDIIYSIMDIDFDKKVGLGSVPAKFGIGKALKISRICYTFFILLLGIAIIRYNLGLFGLISYALTVVLILYQLLLISRKGIASIPKAFNINLIIGVIVGVGYSIAVLT